MRAVKWLKKWAYLIMLIGTGIGYMAFVDHWQVYARSLEQVKQWYHEVADGILSGAVGEDAESAWAPGNAEKGEEESSSLGDALTEREDGTGSGNNGSVEGGTGSENSTSPGDETGSGNSTSPGDGTGSGNSGNR